MHLIQFPGPDSERIIINSVIQCQSGKQLKLQNNVLIIRNHHTICPARRPRRRPTKVLLNVDVRHASVAAASATTGLQLHKPSPARFVWTSKLKVYHQIVAVRPPHVPKELTSILTQFYR